jgi:hypothetical protein
MHTGGRYRPAQSAVNAAPGASGTRLPLAASGARPYVARHYPMRALFAPIPHNPAFPEERRRLAAEVLRAGSALALDAPRRVAEQAERDALYLRKLHGFAWRALYRTDPGRPDRATG